MPLVVDRRDGRWSARMRRDDTRTSHDRRTILG
jgi:hypothetical protein